MQPSTILAYSRNDEISLAAIAEQGGAAASVYHFFPQLKCGAGGAGRPVSLATFAELARQPLEPDPGRLAGHGRQRPPADWRAIPQPALPPRSGCSWVRA